LEPCYNAKRKRWRTKALYRQSNGIISLLVTLEFLPGQPVLPPAKSEGVDRETAGSMRANIQQQIEQAANTASSISGSEEVMMEFHVKQ
jgi:hypothetical protein